MLSFSNLCSKHSLIKFKKTKLHMKNITTLLLLLLTQISFGQFSMTLLDQNNVSAIITDNGCFFNDIATSQPGYEVPSGSGKNALYTSSFWYGGKDVNGQIKLAGQYYCQGQDFWPGPVTRYNPYEWGPNNWGAVQNYFGQSFWTVTKAEIDDHIANYQNALYTAPYNITNWPAHGDTTLGTGDGMLPYIAPFVDVDGDGEYDPTQGDYPCIKGDKATFFIMSDLGGLHTETGADPVGIELHYMFYQYSSVPELQDVTFMDVEVVNMGTQTIEDFTVSCFADPDLGNSQDDYVGCDTIRNMIYAYNGDANDENNGGFLGYGANPPALGIISLSAPIDYTKMISSAMPYPYNDPSTASEFYQVMNGNNLDGSDQLNDMAQPTDYYYYGDPNDPSQWSEVSAVNPPGDRRMVMSSNLGYLTPGISGSPEFSQYNLSYAVIYAQGTDNLNSVTELFSLADYVQNFYNGLTTNCLDPQTVGEEEMEQLSFSMYPNPSAGHTLIQLPRMFSDINVLVTDLSGRRVFEERISNADHIDLNIVENAGVYLVSVMADERTSVQRLIIK